MRSRTLIAMITVAILIAGNAAVIGAPNVEVFARGADTSRSAAAAQYRAPNANPAACRNITKQHETLEDRLASRNSASRAARRAAGARQVRAARKRGATQREIRAIQRKTQTAVRLQQTRHRNSEKNLDRRNDTAAQRLNCGSFTIDR